MRVALIHDWLTGMRGGERVLEAFCELYPEADLYTLVAFPDRLSAPLARRLRERGRTSFVQHLPLVRSRYRYYLPLFPAAIESFELRDYELVLSSSHCVAKGAKAGLGATHVSYIHTPMRYAWGTLEHYFAGGGTAGLMRRGLGAAMAPLREWDRRTSSRVHGFVANSVNVAARVRACYDRSAEVVHPPVELSRFRVGAALDAREDFYLIVSALVPYKRIDVAIHAANERGFRLVIAGEGPELARLRHLAGPRVTLLGRQSDAQVAELYASARALLFPGVEDFGIVPLEAMASGTPVIALGAGGVQETVIDVDDAERRLDSPATGVFFDEQTPASLAKGLARFEARAARGAFLPELLRAHAARFDRPHFLERMRAAIGAALRAGPA